MIKITNGNEECLDDVEGVYDCQEVNVLLPLIERKADIPIFILNHHILRRLNNAFSLEIKDQLSFLISLSQFALEYFDPIVLEILI